MPVGLLSGVTVQHNEGTTPVTKLQSRVLTTVAVLCPLALGLACNTPPSAQQPPAATTGPVTQPSPKPSQPAVRAVRVETLAHFEASEFCSKYRCTRDGDWPLKAGDTNNTYATSRRSTSRPDMPDMSVELTTNDAGRVTGLGLEFYYLKAMRPADYEAIEAFLQAIDTTRSPAAAMRVIRRSIVKPVGLHENVNSGERTTFGDYDVSAAKVGKEYVLSLKRK